MNGRIRIFGQNLETKSLLIGAVALAVLSAVPVVGGYLTQFLNSVRSTVSGFFNKGAK